MVVSACMEFMITTLPRRRYCMALVSGFMVTVLIPGFFLSTCNSYTSLVAKYAFFQDTFSGAVWISGSVGLMGEGALKAWKGDLLRPGSEDFRLL